ncbi:four helix bundle protein [Desulfobulbus alkaliphilus]|uniref:four helix bundle protein n=1 Tax=Desulfobulbus alkaliphilus TaxID=869814 RepID=UPI001966C889|nr:four helix bundle protein [Desulfobulbus alkaliphilus]MBM9537893.1 four helix bundle protein [Desulfobulbus alkaliphilus]
MKFEDLEVWKRSARLSAEIYKALADLKDYGFKDQLCRSGLSVPSNIAEGMERDSQKEFLQFLRFAKGSCGELRTQVYIGQEIGYVEKQKAQAWIQESKEISSMIVGLMKSIKARMATENCTVNSEHSSRETEN